MFEHLEQMLADSLDFSPRLSAQATMMVVCGALLCCIGILASIILTAFSWGFKEEFVYDEDGELVTVYAEDEQQPMLGDLVAANDNISTPTSAEFKAGQVVAAKVTEEDVGNLALVNTEDGAVAAMMLEHDQPTCCQRCFWVKSASRPTQITSNRMTKKESIKVLTAGAIEAGESQLGSMPARFSQRASQQALKGATVRFPSDVIARSGSAPDFSGSRHVTINGLSQKISLNREFTGSAYSLGIPKTTYGAMGSSLPASSAPPTETFNNFGLPSSAVPASGEPNTETFNKMTVATQPGSQPGSYGVATGTPEIHASKVPDMASVQSNDRNSQTSQPRLLMSVKEDQPLNLDYGEEFGEEGQPGSQPGSKRSSLSSQESSDAMGQSLVTVTTPSQSQSTQGKKTSLSLSSSARDHGMAAELLGVSYGGKYGGAFGPEISAHDEAVARGCIFFFLIEAVTRGCIFNFFFISFDNV